MQWFEKSDIKDQSSLTDEQVAYLKRPSLSTLGLFNNLYRKHWDLILVYFITSACAGTLSFFQIPNYIYNSFYFLLTMVACGYLYFCVEHGRRLAWNRNHWKSFEAFKTSENRWIAWALLVLCFSIPIEINFMMKADNLDHKTIRFASWVISWIFGIWPFIHFWWKNKNANLQMEKNKYD